ncbi:YqaE/Pmp3 family membrane protein [Paenibacillus sp. 2RAB27]|uniref:YqaE/Pmp3 family membrane protein n=1 Tax=Paenibacillus sp. 2RAB27 TaxID=3232991 RepID=UPI003F9BB699
MRYLLCFIPPLAVLSCGKIFQFLLSIVLTLLFYIPGVIHAILVVNQYHSDNRHNQLIKAIKKK